MKKKIGKAGYSVPGYQYGGAKPAITNMPLARAQNGMMGAEYGGYLGYIQDDPATAMMKLGGYPYTPQSLNTHVVYIDDTNHSRPHPTTGRGSTMNGASWSKYGGPQGYMPEPLEYAYLQYGGIPDNDGDIDMMKYGGIHIKPENKGKFTAWAKSHGMGVQEAASHVMANKDKYSSTIIKRANFARNIGGAAKKEYGGYIKGSTHELDDHEIQNLISKGYKIRYV
jgi:hypothetical protein